MSQSYKGPPPITPEQRAWLDAMGGKDELGRKASQKEQDEIDFAVAESRRQVRLLNLRADREARAAGSPGRGAYVGRGWVVHPADRGGLPRRSEP